MTDVSRLHNWHHDDYEVAKRDIHQSLGDIADLQRFGRQVLVAVYVRPSVNPRSGMHYTGRTQNEDVWQGKAALILATGPEAFQGDETYLAAQFGEQGPPRIGDWVFAAQNVGIPINLVGENAKPVKAKAKNGDDYAQYPFEAGWPCRILADDQRIGRILKPHSVI